MYYTIWYYVTDAGPAMKYFECCANDIVKAIEHFEEVTHVPRSRIESIEQLEDEYNNVVL